MNGIQAWNPPPSLKGEVPLRKLIIFCTVAAICNFALSQFVGVILGMPLYLDTVFTVAVCFGAGLRPALITGAILTPLSFFVIYKGVFGQPVESVVAELTATLFVICTMLEALLVWFFHKKMKDREAAFLAKPSFHSFTGVATFLLVLAAVDCITISISGGIIGSAIIEYRVPESPFPADTFQMGLLRNNVPLLASAILARIPINIVDRFIAIFGGYGISLLYRKWAGSR